MLLKRMLHWYVDIWNNSTFAAAKGDAQHERVYVPGERKRFWTSLIDSAWCCLDGADRDFPWFVGDGGVVKQANGVDKQHGIRSFMVGKVANRRDGKGETDFLSLSTYLTGEDSWNTWIKKGFDRMRVSSYRITWCAPPVSSLSRAPASVPFSAARHWAAAHMLSTSAQKERLPILLIMLHEQVP